MKDPDCEKYAMAAAGLLPGIPDVELAAHLNICSDCSEEVAQQTAVALRLEGFGAREFKPDLWPDLEKRLVGSPPVADSDTNDRGTLAHVAVDDRNAGVFLRRPLRWPYLVTATLLAAFKLLDLASGEQFAALQIVAGLLVLWLLFSQRAALFRIEGDVNV